MNIMSNPFFLWILHCVSNTIHINKLPVIIVVFHPWQLFWTLEFWEEHKYSQFACGFWVQKLLVFYFWISSKSCCLPYAPFLFSFYPVQPSSLILSIPLLNLQLPFFKLSPMIQPSSTPISFFSCHIFLGFLNSSCVFNNFRHDHKMPMAIVGDFEV